MKIASTLPFFVELCRAYDSQSGQDNFNSNADLNWNQKVDLADLVLLARNYGRVGYGGKVTEQKTGQEKAPPVPGQGLFLKNILQEL